MRTFKVHIQDGSITDGKKTLRAYIQSLKDGDYAVKIEEWKDKRSLRQNALYWRWLEVIGNELGYYKDELHEVFIDQFSDVWTVRGLDGKPKQKRVRTSQMNVKQMARYMDRIEQFAAEQDIQLPQPEDELIRTT